MFNSVKKVLNPEITISSSFLNSCLGKIETFTSFSFFQLNIAPSYVSIEVSIFKISGPFKEDTFEINPPPSVPPSSKFKISFTLYFVPELRILNPLIDPLFIDSIIALCLEISFVSIIKSLSAYSSDILYGKVLRNKLELLNGTLQKISEWDKLGYVIILTTGRKESLRKITENQLNEAGIIYDQLIMGIGGGVRYLINDMKPNSEIKTAVSYNLKRNTGITNINI